MNLKHSTLAALIVTFSVSAFAAQWEKIGTSNHTEVSIDRSKIYADKSNPQQKYVWSKTKVLKNHENFGVNLKPGDYSQILYVYDCQNHRYKQMKAVVYNHTGNVLKTIATPLAWDEIVPESTGDHVFAKVCQ